MSAKSSSSSGPPSISKPRTQSPDFVASLARGLSVIRALSTHQRPMSLSEVATAADLSRPAARRFLITLAELSYVTVSAGRFALTPRVLELGYSYLSGTPLTEIARPHLERMVRELEQSASVAVLDGNDVVYTARVASNRIMRVHIEVGTRLPAHRTSMGRVLLAALPPADLDAYLRSADLTPRTPKSIKSTAALRRELDRVRAEGYAMVDGELEEDIRGLSMPLHGSDHSVVAAANVSIHVRGDHTVAVRDVILPRLRGTVEAIEAELRFASPAPTPTR